MRTLSGLCSASADARPPMKQLCARCWKRVLGRPVRPEPCADPVSYIAVMSSRIGQSKVQPFTQMLRNQVQICRDAAEVIGAKIFNLHLRAHPSHEMAAMLSGIIHDRHIER